jgi:hypothetical protein
MKRAVLLLVLAGCGGGAVQSESTEVQRVSSRDRTTGGDQSDGPQISGLMGTIPSREVEGTLSPRMDRFLGCFEQRMHDVAFLGGDIRLSFRIHVDGTVAWVYPSATSVGDRQAEVCVLDVARSVHFPRPRGGEAEFSWGFSFDPPEDVRPPLSWDQNALGSLADRLDDVRSECGANGAYQVTAYIRPGGRVLAAGGTTPNADSAATLDCILEQVRGWTMRDPGSYPAKITFALN